VSPSPSGCQRQLPGGRPEGGKDREGDGSARSGEPGTGYRAWLWGSIWMPGLRAGGGSSSSSSLAWASSGVMSASARTSKGWSADTNPAALSPSSSAPRSAAASSSTVSSASGSGGPPPGPPARRRPADRHRAAGRCGPTGRSCRWQAVPRPAAAPPTVLAGAGRRPCRSARRCAGRRRRPHRPARPPAVGRPPPAAAAGAGLARRRAALVPGPGPSMPPVSDVIGVAASTTGLAVGAGAGR